MEMSLPLSATAPAPAGATAVPDARGINLYRADPMAAALFAAYLPAPLMAHLAPHFERLGALAGGRLDELASLADKHPPTLSVRSRTGVDVMVIDSPTTGTSKLLRGPPTSASNGASTTRRTIIEKEGRSTSPP